MGSYVEPYVSESGSPSLERLRSRSPDLERPETPVSGRHPPEAAASREQPSSTFSRGGVLEGESASAYYDLGRGGAGRPSSPPHPTMGEARRRRFGDRGSAPWEDPYSHLLGMPVEPSAGTPSGGRGFKGAAVVNFLSWWGAGEGVCQCLLWPRSWGRWSAIFSTAPNHGGSEETTFRWQGFGALGGSIFSPPGDASGTFCWELPTDDGCALPGIVPAGGFRVSGIRSLVPWPGSGAQGSRTSGWGTASGVPCPSSVCWGSTAWTAPHCRFAACACARACGLTVQVAQATKEEEEVNCGEGWGVCRQGVLALPSAGALRGRLPPASWWAHGDCPWGCLGEGDPNGGVSRSQWTGSSCRGTCLFLSGDILMTCRGRYGGGSVSRGTGSAGGSCSCSYGAPFTTGHGGCEPRPDLVVCHGQGVDRWSCGFIGSSWVGTSWATFCAEVGRRHEAPRLSLWEPRQGTTSGEELNSWSSRSHFASSACSSVRWRPQGYVSDPEVACRADEWAWGLPGGYRSTSGANLALPGSGDGFRDPSDACGVHRGFVLRSDPGGVLQGRSCPGGAAPFPAWWRCLRGGTWRETVSYFPSWG